MQRDEIDLRQRRSTRVLTHAEIRRDSAQLAGQILPFAHAHEIDETLTAPLSQLIAAVFLARFREPVPEFEQTGEIRTHIGEFALGLIGGFALRGRALARILDGQAGSENAHGRGHAHGITGDEHAPDTRVQRQARQLTAELGDATVRHRLQLGQQIAPVVDITPLRRVDERKTLDLAQLEVRHGEQHAGEVRAPYFRVGKGRPVVVVVLVEQADTDARGDAPAAPGALIAARLRDRLDRQALYLGGRGIPADARKPRIDDITNARHGQRGFRHVRRQHHAAAVAGRKDAVLGAAGQARIKRHDFGVVPVTGQGFRQMPFTVADIALAGQKHQDVARAFAPELAHTVLDCQRQVGVLFRRAITHRDRIAAPFHVDHRRAAEKPREAIRVDRGGGHDHFQIRTLVEKLLEIAEQEIDVERALVGLVDNDGFVAVEKPVAGRLRQQNAVGHQLDLGGLAQLLFEAGLEPHEFAERRLQFVGDPLADAARRQPTRLRVADQSTRAEPRLHENLGQLRGLAGTGFAADDDHLVFMQRLRDLVGAFGDRQSLDKRYFTPGCRALRRDGGALFDRPLHTRMFGVIARTAQLLLQAMAIACLHRGQQVVGFGGLGQRYS